MLLPLLALLWAGSLAVHPRYMPDLVSVQEGLCALLPCQFYFRFSSLRDFATGSWLRDGSDRLRYSPVATNNPQQQVPGEVQGRFRLLWDLQTRNCSLLIRDAQSRDSGSYFFQMHPENFGRNFYPNPLTVNVTALTHTPDILIHGPLESGRPSNLTCSVPWACEHGTPPIFSWQGPSVSHLGPTVTNSPVLMLTPQPQDHGTTLTCQVTLPGAGVIVEKTVQLNVTYSTRSSTVDISPGPSSGKSEPMAEVVLVTIVEVAVKILLLGLCLFFLRMKYQRKKVARPQVNLDTAMN
ncbi:myeloid cell surface antigen CD33-like isoform X1 [Octodon degus]|uniref:Myeloid cell surface antigen CD33-like isoform X1 n=1 Tax=Octodon degus TaxID=10160 RepID=A0A6P6DKS2_OCTDE|nr:myeloid cell surface antigen CD33-like isoform X1 [Octodon degus]XP_023560652.1 myeloid cell surface antigen CD33-like isoform X1 [Octodon degus]XP_023560653.1 myeloid cell surface antigen CD33-like isoform X1 [Octodon degus]